MNKTPHSLKRIGLAMACLSFLTILNYGGLVSAHDRDRDDYRDWDHDLADGCYDRDHHFHRYEYYHHHRGYWDCRPDGINIFIRI